MASKLIEGLLPPRPDRIRAAPRDLLCGNDDTPPLRTLWAAAVQHTAVALMLTVYSVVAAQELGLPHEQVHGFLGTTILVMALGTLLQSLRSRYGSGFLVVHIPNPISMGTFVAVASQFGLGAAAGGVLVAGAAVALLAGVLPRLRAAFPPEVTGVVVAMLGFSMVEGGVTRLTGLDAQTHSVDPGAVAIGGLTLATIVLLSVTSHKSLRVFAALIGVAVGYLAALAVGQAGTPAASTELPALMWPALALPDLELVLAAALPMLLIELITAVDSIGSVLTLDKMTTPDWRRADMGAVSRSVFAQGVTTIASGLTGTLSTGISSANVGLAFASGVAARRVALVVTALLAVAAFVPPIVAWIIATPQPVVGAVLVYTATYLIVAGVELIVSRMLNPRRFYVVGLSLVAGTAVMVLPELSAQAPSWAHSLSESGLTVAAVTAIGLNLLFRIGIRQRSERLLPSAKAFGEAREFLEQCGREWGARRDVVVRAQAAATEALEALSEANTAADRIRLSASFDEFNLGLELAYPGPPLPLTPGTPDLAAAFAQEDDAALERALANLPAVLLARLADRVTSDKTPTGAVLRLHFEH